MSAFWYNDPFEEMRHMQRDMNRIFGNFFDNEPAARLESHEQPRGQLAVAPRRTSFWPSVDIKENDNAITVNAELPGMKKEDINISVENGVLTISGERSQEKKEESEKYHRVERSYGSFRRSFALPENVKEADIKASYSDGVLKVDVPKSPVTKPESKKITVE